MGKLEMARRLSIKEGREFYKTSNIIDIAHYIFLYYKKQTYYLKISET